MTARPMRHSCDGRIAAGQAGLRLSGCSSTARRVCSSASVRHWPCPSSLIFPLLLRAPAQAVRHAPAKPPARSGRLHRAGTMTFRPVSRIFDLPRVHPVAMDALYAAPVRSRPGSAVKRHNPLSTCAHFWESEPTSRKGMFPRETTDPHAPREIGLVRLGRRSRQAFERARQAQRARHGAVVG